MIKVIAIGIVKEAPRTVTPAKGGKPFVSVVVEVTKSFGGKDYTNRVNFCAYWRTEDVLNGIHAGMLVCVDGEGSADTYRGNNGQTYGSLKVVGSITPVNTGGGSRPAAAAPRPQARTAPAPVQQAEPEPGSQPLPGEDDVPF
jgi:hypothetical protein